MRKTEIIGILIFIILTLVYGISLIKGPEEKKQEISCNNLCYEIDEDKWDFPGAFDLNNPDYFETEDECISACRLKVK